VEPLLGLVAAAIAASIGYLVASERRRAHLRAWHQAAQRAGLAEVEEKGGSPFGGGAVCGSAGEMQVRLESYRRGKYERGTKIVVTGLGHGAGGLSLRREGFATAIEKGLVGEREIEIGDRAFDDEYYVQGQAPLALAILDPETRGRVAGLLRGRIAGPEPAEVHASLADGVLEVRVKESGFTGNRERVPEILAGVLQVARLLVAPRDVAARIAANMRAEPEAGARLKGVLMLAREFPKHPATRETLLAARQDPSEEVRLRAAMALGEEGRETLVDLVAREGTEDSCAARAIDALGGVFPEGLAESTLRRALGGVARSRTAQACLDALARLGRAEAEGLILDALRSQDGKVAVAAARALGRVGTVAAVPALSAAMQPRGELLRSVGRQAIAEIQSRLAGAGPGQLSLAAGDAGALSLAGGEPGRLSLAEGQAERMPSPHTEEEPEEATPARRGPRELA
jgi:HEAT repeat protein